MSLTSKRNAMLAWLLAVNGVIFVAAYGSSWFILLLFPLAALVWWLGDSWKPFFVSMWVAVIGVTVRAHERVMHAWYLYRRNVHAVETLEMKQELNSAIEIAAKLLVPVGVGLLVAVVIALLCQFVSRRTSKPTGADAEQKAGTPGLSRFGYIQLPMLALIGILMIAMRPAGAALAPKLVSANLWGDIDRGIREPGAFSAVMTSEMFPSAGRIEPSPTGIAAPCIELASTLATPSRPNASVDLPSLTRICAMGAMDGRDGFENELIRRYFATTACGGPGGEFLHVMAASDATRFKKRFCEHPDVEVVAIVPLDAERSNGDAGESAIVSYMEYIDSPNERAFIARIDGRLQQVWSVATQPRGRISVVDGKVVNVASNRIRSYKLDTGEQDDKVYGIPGTIDDIVFNPRRRWEAFVSLADKSHVLVDLRTGDVKRGAQAPLWSKPSRSDPSVQACPGGTVSPSGARCELPEPSRLPKSLGAYEPLVLLSDDEAAILVGTSLVGRSRMLLGGLDRKRNSFRWQREIEAVGWRRSNTSLDMAHGRLISWTSKLVAVDLQSGNVLWEATDVPRDERSRWNMMAITKTRVYLREAGGGHPLNVRDVNTGRLIGTVEDL